MAVSQEYVDHLMDVLSPLGPIGARRMMGGVMLHVDGLTIGLVANDVFYMKVGDNNRQQFEDAGSGPFTYMRGDKQFALKSHWRAPEHLMDDGDEMLTWARGSLDAAVAADKAKPKKKAKKKPKKK